MITSDTHAPNGTDRESLGAAEPQPEGSGREVFSPAIRYHELDHYSQERTVYRLKNLERYHLRQSELYTMAEAGKFRAVSIDNLEKYVYSGNREMMARDFSNLENKGSSGEVRPVTLGPSGSLPSLPRGKGSCERS